MSRQSLPVGLTDEQADLLKKLVLWDVPDHVDLLVCERVLEQGFPGVTHKVGIVEGMPPFERYLRCSKFLTEIFNFLYNGVLCCGSSKMMSPIRYCALSGG